MPSSIYLFVLFLSLLTPAGASRQAATANGPQQAPKTRTPAALNAPATAQSPAAPTKPDYSKEAFVEEKALVKVDFQTDGTSTREAYDRIRVQSDAGVQHFSVMTFPYESATQDADH